MKSLILKSKSGDERSIEEILKNFEPLIFNTSISFYIYGYDSEDIKQVAKLAIIKGIKIFNLEEEITTFAAYIKTCVRNEMYKEIEKASKVYYKEKESKELALLFDIKEVKDEKINILEDFIKKEQEERLILAIKTLEEDEIALLKNIYINQITLKEYSESINLEYYKARYMKERVLKKLKRILEKI